MFGVASTINAANFVYFFSAGASRGCVVGESQCRSLNNDEAMNVFIKELISLHRGQVMEREDSKE